MSKLNAKARSALPSQKFALPKQRKYPVNDPAHAANAKARATQQENKGNITAGQKAQIDRKANKILGKSK